MAKRMKMIGAEKTIKTLLEFQKRTGKSAEEGMKNIALSSARLLAHRVQPYGTKSNIGKQFQSSIAAQVSQVWFGVNIGAYPANTDMRNAHYSARKNGKVQRRQFRKEKGKPWLDLIPESERDTHIRRQQEKAGRAKAAWIEAGNAIGLIKISGMPKWISRHINSGFGTQRLTGSGMTCEVSLHNRTPYLTTIQKPNDIQEATKEGRQRGIKRMEYLIRQEIKKTKLGQ
jgi:hypothetical protein